MHILIRHSFTGATKPTFVAKSLHEPLLLFFRVQRATSLILCDSRWAACIIYLYTCLFLEVYIYKYVYENIHMHTHFHTSRFHRGEEATVEVSARTESMALQRWIHCGVSHKVGPPMLRQPRFAVFQLYNFCLLSAASLTMNSFLCSSDSFIFGCFLLPSTSLFVSFNYLFTTTVQTSMWDWALQLWMCGAATFLGTCYCLFLHSWLFLCSK